MSFIALKTVENMPNEGQEMVQRDEGSKRGRGETWSVQKMRINDLEGKERQIRTEKSRNDVNDFWKRSLRNTKQFCDHAKHK